MVTERYDAATLTRFASDLLVAVGMTSARAEVVARILVEGDLMGHTTHGLQLMGPYLNSVAKKEMLLDGEPEIITSRPVTELWDGKNLPGPWLVENGFARATQMALEFGTGTIVIRRCHHIGCLAAYMLPIAEQNLLGLLVSSDPANSTVSPYGGITPIYSPNPVAACFPTEDDPVILDISMSTTTNGLCMRSIKNEKKLPYRWVKDPEGQVSDDPADVFSDPPGSILPLGGIGSGHKGFGLGLLVEALTSGLAGYGRADGTKDWGATVYVQVQDIGSFSGGVGFRRETSWLADACRKSKTAPGDEPVRLPGEAGLARRRQALKDGVELYPGIKKMLNEWANKLGIQRPASLNSQVQK